MNRWLRRRQGLAVCAVGVLLGVLAFKLPASPAAGIRFERLTGELPFDERLAGYTLSGVLAALRALGPQGLADYACYRAVDAVFPWLLCGLVAAVMLRLDAPRTTAWAWLAASADTVENALQLRILLTRDDLSPRLVQWASLATQLKWALYAMMLLALLAAGARALLPHLIRKPNS